MLLKKIVISIFVFITLQVGTLHANDVDKVDSLFNLSLEELLDIDVVTATGRAQIVNDAPAIISVITKHELQDWQVTSVAEALNRIPGIFCSNDYMSMNCGVRGISGGDRGHSKILKTMVNGQSVAFRSDTNNYLGMELIPINSIERIEVVRGPVSALYGANAFLGVINIITKRAINDFDLSFNGSVEQLNEGVGHQLSISLLGKVQDWYYSFAFNTSQQDRSGQAIPDTIPALSPLEVGQKSKQDIAKPISMYADIGTQYQHVFNDTDKLDINISAWYSRLETSSQWQSFGFFNQSKSLGFEQKISLENSFLKTSINYAFNESLSVNTAVAIAQGEPTSNELIDVGAPSFIPKREFGFSAVDYKSEINWIIDEAQTLVVGVDTQLVQETLFKAYRIDRETGSATLATADLGIKDFNNTGVYAQYTGYIEPRLGITVNIREDDHNIYGKEKSYRTGFVYKFDDELSTKLVVGSSFKAPAAIQLFTQPLFSGEVIGNPNLSPEKAETVEIGLDWKFTDDTHLSVNIFTTDVEDKVEVLGEKAFNVGLQSTNGIEADIKKVTANWSVVANISWQKTDAETQNFIGELVKFPSELYPMLMANIFVSYKFTEYFNLHTSYQYVSERRASQTNILLNGNTPYQLEPYQLINLTTKYNLQDGLELYSKVTNLFNSDYQVAGFNGIDIAGQPLTFAVGLNYRY